MIVRLNIIIIASSGIQEEEQVREEAEKQLQAVGNKDQNSMPYYGDK